MKYLKMVGLAAAAAMALMMFVGAGAASATTLWITTAGVPEEYTGAITGTLAQGTSVQQTSTGGTVLDTCTTSQIGSPESVTTAQGTKTATINELAFGGEGCGYTVIDQDTSLEVHHISGTTNATVTGTGGKVKVHSPFGECHYGLGGTYKHYGTLTGSTSVTATLHVNTVTTEVTSRLACPDTSRWIATYTLTVPDELWVEA